ncbi:MAG: hypothetical protein D8M58_14845 [Calditrichaeota bacterium]|nr:MAG: hypothetical protein DWQ03_16085 [Calditrichota bacterium]MBL1206680.1 hypothetical protein [Calditrichota bacterium]NOG46507.1 hypothetical protein [Calditrichota bacterium]
MKSKIFVILILLSGMVFSQETLQPYHWANSYIDYFIVRGDLQKLDKLNRPFSRMEITKLLLKLDLESDTFSAKEQKMLKLLLREFEFEGRQLVKEESGSGWLNLMNKAMSFLGKSKDKLGFKAGAYAIAGYNSLQMADSSFGSFQLNPRATLSFQDILTLQLNIRIFNKAPENYIGKKFSGVYAYTEQSYLSLNTDWFGLKFGRDYMQSGPGQTGQLLFSDNSQPFDMYHVRLGKSTVQFLFWGMLMNAVSTAGSPQAKFSNTADRYLNGHKLSFNIANKYRFAFSEVILYGGANQGWDMGLVNPLMFYYGYNLNNSNFDANIMYNFEWDLYFDNNIEFYGEFLLDDFQVEKKSPGDLEPNELGLIAGVKWGLPFGMTGSLINAEYVQVRNRTYNVKNNRWEKYLHRNQVIGYALGNNLERYYLEYNWWALPELKVAINAGLIRQGEGTVQGEFNTDFENYTVEEGYDEPFPFGTVESDIHTGINVFYKPANIGHIELDISNHSFTNYNQIKGNDENDLQVRLNLWLQWDYIFNQEEDE